MLFQCVENRGNVYTQGYSIWRSDNKLEKWIWIVMTSGELCLSIDYIDTESIFKLEFLGPKMLGLLYQRRKHSKMHGSWSSFLWHGSSSVVLSY